MSLINDALKKAQHQRTGPVDLPPMPGQPLGSRGVRRGKTMPAQTLAIIIASAAALVIVAVGTTAYFLTRETPAPRPAPHPVAAKPVVSEPAPAATPVIAAPVVAAPAPKIDLSKQKLPAAEAVTVVPTEAKPKPEPVVAAVAPPPAPVAEAPHPVLPGGQDIRILTYIDAIRVAGIRSSGKDSKVLMNDRVYRMNDMVDYTLGLRLTKVADDGLTFTDANGTTYVKNF